MQTPRRDVMGLGPERCSVPWEARSSPHRSPILHRPIPSDWRLGHDLAQPEPRQGGVVQLDAEAAATDRSTAPRAANRGKSKSVEHLRSLGCILVEWTYPNVQSTSSG